MFCVIKEFVEDNPEVIAPRRDRLCNVGCVWCRCLNLFQKDHMALMRNNIRLTEYSDYDVRDGPMWITYLMSSVLGKGVDVLSDCVDFL